MSRWFYGRAVSGYNLDPSAPVGPDGAPLRYFPGEQGRSVRLALEIAEGSEVPVKVVDVNLPGDDAPLVTRFVTTATLLPLLVAPDGRTLEGESDFVPSRLRSFLRG
jgi:hypothetical protein